jgi:hypothetical protein
MSAEFDQLFLPSTLGRSISSKLTLGPPPAALDLMPWSLRFADFDVMNHVNNSVAFVIVEEVLAQHRDLRAPMRVEVEYRSSIDATNPRSVARQMVTTPGRRPRRNGAFRSDRLRLAPSMS